MVVNIVLLAVGFLLGQWGGRMFDLTGNVAS